MDFKRLLEYCQAELPAMLRCLRRAVEIESPSRSKTHLDRMAGFFAAEFRRAGGTVRLLKHPTAGSGVAASFWDGQKGRPGRGKPILLLGHLDTVWDVGTLAEMPFQVRGGRAYGPGTFDMKSGIVCGLTAIRALQQMGVAPRSPVRIFLNSDEEISSLAFRRQILSEGRRARAVLVLEPAAEGGALKIARKGVGEFRLTARGRSAHAGINPQAGINAISELARQILRIEKFARPGSGLTLTVGMISGGTRTNVVPERATAAIDIRVPRAKGGRAIERKIHALKPCLPGARLTFEGGMNRPPLEAKMSRELFELARRLGRCLGMDLHGVSTGGGSDGNFTAALGTRTLDGLGGVGDGAHARHEHVIISELPRRAALLAALLAHI